MVGYFGNVEGLGKRHGKSLRAYENLEMNVVILKQKNQLSPGWVWAGDISDSGWKQEIN
jgi:hypothetical protein